MTAGIDDIAIYIPRLYLDAGDFAKARGLDPEKLERGLGISQWPLLIQIRILHVLRQTLV